MNKKDKYALSFVVRFSVILIVFQVVVLGIHQSVYLSNALQETLAIMAANLYAFFDGNVYVVGNRLHAVDSKNFVFVDNDCTGLPLMATVTAIILALRGNKQQKIIGLICILSVLFVLNLIRISHLFYIAAYAWHLFELFHLYIWQVINFIVALVLIYGYRKLSITSRTL